MQKINVLKPTFFVTLISIGTILIGFLTQILIAYFFGSGKERDAYFGAVIIPTYIITVFIGSIGALFLSNFIKISVEKSRHEATFFLSNLFKLIFLLLSFISIFLYFFSKDIVNIVLPGFSGSQYLIVVKMLKILSPTIVFQSLTYICVLIYQSRNSFVFSSLPSIISPIINFVFIALFYDVFGIVSLAWGSLLGNAVSFVIIFLALCSSNDFLFEFNIRINSEIIYFFKNSITLILASIIFRFSGVWERFLASELPQGSVSYLGYANQLLIVFSTLSTGGIATVFFPIFSNAWHNNDLEFLRLSFQKALSMLIYLTFPFVTIFVFLRADVIQVLFERGSFNHISTIAVADTLAIFMGAFVFQSLGSIIVKSYYFMGKSLEVSIIGIIEILVYIILSLFLLKNYSFKGLAFSFSFATMINILISTYRTNKIINYINMPFIFNIIKIILSCVFALIVINICSFKIDNIFINLILNSITFILIYIFTTYLLRIEITFQIKNIIKNIIYNGKNRANL